MKVRDSVPIDVSKDVIDALTVMFRKKERLLPVMDGSSFVGTVRISDYLDVMRRVKNEEPESIHLGEIVDRKPVTASPNAPIEEVIDRLCEKGVYAMPVVSGHELISMVRREDILRRFLPLLKGKFKVKDVMSYSVSTHSIHEPLESLSERILSGMDRRVVIMDYNKIEGTLTIQDLANVLLADKADLSGMSVKDIMAPNPVTIRKCDDAMKAGELMLEWSRWGIPVADKELEGMVRDKDLVQRIHIIR